MNKSTIIYADVHYHEGMIGPSARWSVALGYDDNINNLSWGDCQTFAVKPTKRQIRQLKKFARLHYLRALKEREWEDVIIDVMKWNIN